MDTWPAVKFVNTGRHNLSHLGWALLWQHYNTVAIPETNMQPVEIIILLLERLQILDSTHKKQRLMKFTLHV